MKIIRNEIRPIGYCTLELSEAEIQSIIGTIEQVQVFRNVPMEEIGGIRGEMYLRLKEVLNNLSPNS